MTHAKPPRRCPGPATCPLYALSLSEAHARLGCVRADGRRRCRVERGGSFKALFDRVRTRLFARWFDDGAVREAAAE